MRAFLFPCVGEPEIDDRKQGARGASAAIQSPSRTIPTWLLAEQLEGLVRESTTEQGRLSALVNALAHDLKAPVRGLRVCVTWLEKELDGALSDKARENLGFLRSRADHVAAVLDGMQTYVDVQRVSSGLAAVDTRSLIEGVVARFSVKAPARVSFFCDSGSILCDRSELEEILNQLISNALCFAARPDVHVEVEARDEGDQYRFSVKDNGPGVAPDEQERIFNLFFRGRSATEPGLGVGLSICKALTERNGGTIGVSSLEGEGSTFWFTCPKASERHAS